MEQPRELQLTNKMEPIRLNEISNDVPNILDPDDALMAKFQKTLKLHLLRVDERLSEEIFNLEASTKRIDAELEAEGAHLYSTQKEVQRQRDAIEQYEAALRDLVSLKDHKSDRVDSLKVLHSETRSKLEEEKKRQQKLSRDLEKLLELQGRFTEWEKELSEYLKVSKRMSGHDSAVRKELMEKKQRNDYILFRLEEEIWRLEAEITYLDEQLQGKDQERANVGRLIVDANTDLEALHREHKSLGEAWNSVVGNISKRDKVHEQLYTEREEVAKSYEEVLLEIEKLRKETDKEIESNECLTSLCSRVETNIQSAMRAILTENSRIENFESELLKIAKFGEQTRGNYDLACTKYRSCSYKEEQANKELEVLVNRKNELERAIFAKLEDKVVKDKAARHVSDLLLNSKETILEYELLVARTENSYGASLLELERLTNGTAMRRSELQEISERNVDREKEIRELRKETRKYEATIERKQRKLISLNRTIEEILPKVDGEELSPQELKIASMEKNVRDIRQSVQKAQQFWMRQQGFAVSLSQQRDTQLCELNLLNKEIMIMEQKNLKLEYALQNLSKEEAIASRTLNLLEQKASRMNADFVARKGLKDELENKNCIAKNEYVISFEDLEFELVKLQSDLRSFCNEKVFLRDELKAAQEESLSWEKKVQLTQETIRRIKEERSAGGIASMKNEIHKMEMRLSHLHRVQEKLIHDMEFCVSRREILVDKAIGKIKRNPKERHNRKVVFNKRLIDQKSKIKHLLKGVRQTDKAISEKENEVRSVQDKLRECKTKLNTLDETIPNINKEIDQFEAIKYHNLQNLVFKQRKAGLLRDIKNGRYKATLRHETSIEEDLNHELIYRNHLKHVMEKTSEDFPLLNRDIGKILLTMRVF